MSNRLAFAVLATLLAACTSPDSSLDPNECGPNAPCAAGFACDPATRRCVRHTETDVADAAPAVPDAPLPPDARPGPDAPLRPDARPRPDAAAPDAPAPDASSPDAASPDAAVSLDAPLAPDTILEDTPPPTTSSRAAQLWFHADRDGAVFECRLDGSPYAPCGSPAAYDHLAEGGHRFIVRALADGLADPTPADYRWTIDRTPPETRISDGPAADVATASASFGFVCSTPPCTFECSADGAPFAACTTPHVLAGLGHGGHTFAVRASDAAGNVDPTPATAAWFVHLVPPTTIVLLAPVNPTVIGGATNQTFEFACVENDEQVPCTFICAMDLSATSACTSPTSYVLGTGSHTFWVRATDRAGVIAALWASYSWDNISVPK